MLNNVFKSEKKMMRFTHSLISLEETDARLPSSNAEHACET